MQSQPPQSSQAGGNAAKKNSPIRRNQQKESNKKAAGGTIKLSRAVDKYAGPLALQLLVIMAEHARYVALQLRLAALLVMR